MFIAVKWGIIKDTLTILSVAGASVVVMMIRFESLIATLVVKTAIVSLGGCALFFFTGHMAFAAQMVTKYLRKS